MEHEKPNIIFFPRNLSSRETGEQAAFWLLSLCGVYTTAWKNVERCAEQNPAYKFRANATGQEQLLPRFLFLVFLLHFPLPCPGYTPWKWPSLHATYRCCFGFTLLLHLCFAFILQPTRLLTSSPPWPDVLPLKLPPQPVVNFVAVLYSHSPPLFDDRVACARAVDRVRTNPKFSSLPTSSVTGASPSRIAFLPSPLTAIITTNTLFLPITQPLNASVPASSLSTTSYLTVSWVWAFSMETSPV